MTTNIIQTAQDWMAQDPDSETRLELQQLIEANNTEELTKRFATRLAFGTAGLRGPIQAGTNGMNRVLVAQTAAGLACFLLEREKQQPTGKALSVVIGFDGRKNSDIFAQDTAQIMQAMGVQAHIMPDMRPTPVLAFAVRRMDATAGVMVTASHNPPEDNGYKVYLGDADTGAQIVSPTDAQIAEHIDYVAQNMRVNELVRSDDFQVINTSIIEQFVEQTVKICQTAHQEPTQQLSVNYVYTAMHGVGTETLLKTLAKANFPLPTLVDEQCTPDGTFPTVAFPNPEEPGALDLAMAKAKQVGAQFIIANDPDADRLAVAIPDTSTATGWRSLHGNEVGLLLGWHLAQQAQAKGTQGVLACSMVSSPVLGDIAHSYGLEYQETLTGFKWIGRIPGLIFGFEEALGYLVNPDCAHDKDGISAIMCFLDLVRSLQLQGKTFAQYQAEFTQKFGAVCSDQVSIRVEDLSVIGKVLAHVRANPFETIADLAVENYTDHLQTDKNSNILVFSLTNGNRVIFRPSGTEPKLKIYIDTKGTDTAQAQQINKDIQSFMHDFLSEVQAS